MGWGLGRQGGSRLYACMLKGQFSQSGYASFCKCCFCNGLSSMSPSTDTENANWHGNNVDWYLNNWEATLLDKVQRSRNDELNIHQWTGYWPTFVSLQTLRSGSVVECLTRDWGAAGSSLTGVTALWSLSKTHLSLLSTGSTQEDTSLFNWKIVDWM